MCSGGYGQPAGWPLCCEGPGPTPGSHLAVACWERNVIPCASSRTRGDKSLRERLRCQGEVGCLGGENGVHRSTQALLAR